MAKYVLRVGGWGFEGSAHTLTNDEVQKIMDFKKENGYEDNEELYSDLPEILEGYDHYDTNWWVASRPMINDRLHFSLVDEDEQVVWDKDIKEFRQWWDDESNVYPEDADDNTVVLDAYPHEGKENILFVYEEVKGVLQNYTVESDEVPQPEDFTYSSQSLESIEYELELMDKMFFKGNQLEIEYDEEWWTGKGLTVEINRLVDLEDEFDDDDDDEDWDDDDE